MAIYNVTQKKRNPANNGWDTLYPITKAENVIAGTNGESNLKNPVLIVGKYQKPISNFKHQHVSIPSKKGLFLSISDIVYGNGIFVAVTSQYIIKSNDLINWEISLSNTSNDPFEGIAYGNGIFVFISRNIVYRSTDAINWTSTTPDSAVYSWSNIHYYLNKFFLFRTLTGTSHDGRYCYSSDGISWTSGSIPGNASIKDATYGNGKMVIAGFNKHGAYSTNGINWSQISLPDHFNSITYGDGLFLAGGYGGGIYTSQDGINFSQKNDTFYSVYSVNYALGKFIIISQEIQSDRNRSLCYSEDGGLSWYCRKVDNYTLDTNVKTEMFVSGGYIIIPSNNGLLYRRDTEEYIYVLSDADGNIVGGIL